MAAKLNDEGKWIKFEQSGDTGKTKIWNVVTKDKGVVLGIIRWHASWRKYSFFPRESTIFETTCLMDIINFIQQEMAKRKWDKNRASFSDKLGVKIMSDLNDKDKRIVKWYLEGCSCEKIAKKIGMPGQLWRVLDALRLAGYEPQSFGADPESPKEKK